MKDLESKRKDIATRLKIARDMAGLSQGQVARLLDLHRPTVSEIEAGRRRVSAEELATFARLYKVNTSWLACEDEPESAIPDKIQLAARELSKLKPDEIDRVIAFLTAIRATKERGDDAE